MQDDRRPRLRVQLTDTVSDMCVKMAEGNPGALSVIAQVLDMGKDQLGTAGILLLLSLDAYGIYGPDIWVLYKDCCGQDIDKFVRALESLSYDLISEDVFLDHIQKETPMPVAEWSDIKRKILAQWGEPEEQAGK